MVRKLVIIMPNEERLIEIFADILDRDDIMLASYDILSDGKYSKYNDEQNKELIKLTTGMWGYAASTNQMIEARRRINVIVYKALKKNLEKQ